MSATTLDEGSRPTLSKQSRRSAILHSNQFMELPLAHKFTRYAAVSALCRVPHGGQMLRRCIENKEKGAVM